MNGVRPFKAGTEGIFFLRQGGREMRRGKGGGEGKGGRGRVREEVIFIPVNTLYEAKSSESALVPCHNYHTWKINAS